MASEEEDKVAELRVTNKMIYNLLKDHIDDDKIAQQALYDAVSGTHSHPGVYGRLTKLEATVDFQKKTGWTIFVAMIGSALAWWKGILP